MLPFLLDRRQNYNPTSAQRLYRGLLNIKTKIDCFQTGKISVCYVPVCLPFLLASFLKATLAREWTTAGFLMMRPSRWRRAILRRELAREISLISLGSSQILRCPHLRTSAARRFCNLSDTVSQSIGWCAQKFGFEEESRYEKLVHVRNLKRVLEWWEFKSNSTCWRLHWGMVMNSDTRFCVQVQIEREIILQPKTLSYSQHKILMLPSTLAQSKSISHGCWKNFNRMMMPSIIW